MKLIRKFIYNELIKHAHLEENIENLEVINSVKVNLLATKAKILTYLKLEVKY